jgi:hypothetical protein
MKRLKLKNRHDSLNFKIYFFNFYFNEKCDKYKNKKAHLA